MNPITLALWAVLLTAVVAWCSHRLGYDAGVRDGSVRERRKAIAEREMFEQMFRRWP